MLNGLRRYAYWLHLSWPAGRVEPMPEVRPDGSTALPGVFVAGDLNGTPLLKFALDGGTRVARRIARDPALRAAGGPGVLDLVVLGGGVAGMAAAIEAHRSGLSCLVVEAAEPFSTLVRMPRAKPIFTYPSGFVPEGALQATAGTKEALVAELRAQLMQAGIAVHIAAATRIARMRGLLRVELEGAPALVARRVVIAIGRGGQFRRLEVPGGQLDTVTNGHHDPAPFAEREVLVVGGGDSALETAIALARAGAAVTLAHRGDALARPKREALESLAGLSAPPDGPPVRGRISLRLGTQVREIRPRDVVLGSPQGETALTNDAVFTMLGRDPPLEFFRRSGLPIWGEMTRRRWVGLGMFLAFCGALFDWKSGGRLAALGAAHHAFPSNLPEALAAAGGAVAAAAQQPATALGTLAISATSPSFWYTLAFSIVVVVFGLRRIRRRRTPYVTLQTLSLMAVQVLPLFLLPELVLPLLHHRGLLPAALEDALFPACGYGHGREFWRAYGLILAWPLDVYNVFTHQPLWAWIAIGFVQTFVLIPLAVWRWGKGAYCGWVCSCGALAETLGDTQRQKMPHGPTWNRLNLAGQVVLGLALALLGVRIVGWALPAGNGAERAFEALLMPGYQWSVDVFLAGVLGTGAYFWLSGRVWCRFLCPLAALMHVYARVSRFRIFADQPKCISCGVCTAACHQGIDVMSFANRGLPLADPECVRCSACVHECPTGVLAFGHQARGGWVTLDSLAASPVRQREQRRA